MLALAAAAGGCRRPAEGASGRAYTCLCSYLTDYDDTARIEVDVCVPSSKTPPEAAATCASDLSRNYAESCSCGSPRDACTPGAPGACRNR
ncbi:MAG TPA: hypothetical protein VFS43_34670 [Polyangiaceae bacterium]|nr:hypothetical protein [Polyangiaceae bacterium]